MTKIPFERLPSAVVPKHYNLELKPDLLAFTFSGNVSIEIQVKIKNSFELFVFVLVVYLSNGSEVMNME